MVIWSYLKRGNYYKICFFLITDFFDRENIIFKTVQCNFSKKIG